MLRQSLPLGILGIALLGFWLVPEPTASPAASPREAKGDGVADDTAAIQKAVDAGGLIHLPRGTFKITKTILVDLDRVGFTAITGGMVARVVMAGEGPAFKFVGSHGGTADPPTMRPNVWKNQRAPSVDGLEIVGDHDAADGIEATGTMQLTLTRVVVRHCRHAIHLTERNRNVLVSECHLYDNRGIGLFLDNVNLHQINVTGSHISYNADGGVVVKAGQVRNLHITGCDIEANQGEGRPPTANVLVDSAGGSNAEVAITGCTIQHSRKAAGAANIRIKGPSTAVKDIPELRDGHVTITGNIMSDTRVGIHLQHVRGVTIMGNTCWTAMEHTLLVENSSNIVVGPNNFDRNPRYNSEEKLAADAILFRDCQDCTISGLQVHGVRQAPAGIVLEKCERFNLTGLTILDCENCGLMLKDVRNSRVSDCLIRDDRPLPNIIVKQFSIIASGGGGNMIVDNFLGHPSEILAGVGLVERNYTPK